MRLEFRILGPLEVLADDGPLALGGRQQRALLAGDVVSSYDCRICGEIPELLALADERLASTGRELTPEERELYLG